jgi:hypothetical protein
MYINYCKRFWVTSSGSISHKSVSCPQWRHVVLMVKIYQPFLSFSSDSPHLGQRIRLHIIEKINIGTK